MAGGSEDGDGVFQVEEQHMQTQRGIKLHGVFKVDRNSIPV